MNVNDIYPSKYVKAHDLGDKNVTVTVKSAAMEDLGYGKEAERKLVIHFEKATKGLILNRTNAMIIASMYGPETDNWLGQPITLYAARVKAFGAWHDAVRVREQIPARNVGASRIPEAMTEAPPLDDEDDLLDVDEGQAPPRVDPDTGEIMAPQATQTHQDEISNGDVLFDTIELVGPSELVDLLKLGRDFYGVEWDRRAHELALAVSKKRTVILGELTPREAATLVDGITKKMDDIRKAEAEMAQATEPVPQ